MAKISRDYSPGTLHPRETLFIAGNLGSLNAEIILPCDGTSTVSLDLRGTFNLTIEVLGSIDGANWTVIPMRGLNQTAVGYNASIGGVAPGAWVGKCSPFRQVRARVLFYTSGTANTVLVSSAGQLDDSLQGIVTSQVVTNTGAAGAGVTLTLPAPGSGLRHYLTYIAIGRFASAVLTPAAVPVILTTTNLPGGLAYSIAADGAGQGSMSIQREDYAQPLVAVAQNTTTTFSAPITAGVIWRLSAGYYVAP